MGQEVGAGRGEGGGGIGGGGCLARSQVLRVQRRLTHIIGLSLKHFYRTEWETQPQALSHLTMLFLENQIGNGGLVVKGLPRTWEPESGSQDDVGEGQKHLLQVALWLPHMYCDTHTLTHKETQ